MKLQYKIEYIYDYGTKSIVIILRSAHFQKEYPCTSINNIPAILGHALLDFNKEHEFIIEDLENEETIKSAKERQSRRQKSEAE